MEIVCVPLLRQPRIKRGCCCLWSGGGTGAKGTEMAERNRSRGGCGGCDGSGGYALATPHSQPDPAFLLGPDALIYRGAAAGVIGDNDWLVALLAEDDDPVHVVIAGGGQQ
jgi:hypothetical protein